MKQLSVFLGGAPISNVGLKRALVGPALVGIMFGLHDATSPTGSPRHNVGTQMFSPSRFSFSIASNLAQHRAALGIMIKLLRFKQSK